MTAAKPYHLAALLSTSLILLLSGCSAPKGLQATEETTAEVSVNISGLNAFNKVSAVEQRFSSQSSDSNWNMSPPSALEDVTCFAIAVDWPGNSKHQDSCRRQSGQTFAPGLMQGLYKAGDTIVLKIPTGDKRKVYLLGFRASSPQACVPLNGINPILRDQLSAPLIIGELELNLSHNARQAEITIIPSMVSAEPIEDCSGPKFDGPRPNPEPTPSPDPAPAPAPAPAPVPDPVPAIEPAPKVNAANCAGTLLGSNLPGGAFACLGLWDFSDSFGQDQNMCGGAGSAYTAPALHCRVPAAACASGFATATSMRNIYPAWDSLTDGVDLASDAEVAAYANILNSSPQVLRRELIRVWNYSCEAVAPPPPPPQPPMFSAISMDSCFRAGVNNFGNAFQGYDVAMTLPQCQVHCQSWVAPVTEQPIACYFRSAPGVTQILRTFPHSLNLTSATPPQLTIGSTQHAKTVGTETVKYVPIFLTLNGGLASDLNISFQTENISAVSGQDYEATSASITILAGLRQGIGFIRVSNSPASVGKTFLIRFNVPANGIQYFGNGTATITIR